MREGMKISKKDALCWFEFFAGLDDGEELSPKQMEIAYATLYQIERAIEFRRNERLKKLKGAQSLNGRTLMTGNLKKLPKGCVSCLTGSGLNAIRKTNKCNLNCKFCYDYGEISMQEPIGEGLWEIGGSRLYLEDIALALKVQQKPTGVCYVYLEPFLEIEKYYDIIRLFHENAVYQHMYTNGTLANEENLKALAEAGLDELRFNLGASGCSDRVIENIALAKKYIRLVGIETPMTREFFETFLLKKEKILETKLDFINCAELHLNRNNMDNYYGEDMYMTRLGYLSPVFSRDISIEMLLMCERENWDIAVHDCSNKTKLARNLNLKAKEGAGFGASDYGRELYSIPFEYFLPILGNPEFKFLEEEELPRGYRIGDLVI